MIEQTKNPNEYREDGKVFVKQIKRCICKTEEDGTYRLECKIIQRGRHDYIYRRGADNIPVWMSNKVFWLSPDAKATVEKAVDDFDAVVKASETDEFRTIVFEEMNFSVSYRPVQNDYDFVLRYTDNQKMKTEVMRNAEIGEFLRYLRFNLRHFYDLEMGERFNYPNEENISEHPFVVDAKKNGDLLLELKVKHFYRLDTYEECLKLSELLGFRLLPPLPPEFDRAYVVDSGTVTEEYWKLLVRSNYMILHTPYFGMMGKTHAKWTINPHRRVGGDATTPDREAISFDDFLALFDTPEASPQKS